MTWKDKAEIGLKEDAQFRKDNLPPNQVRGPEIPSGPGRSPEIPMARGDKNHMQGPEATLVTPARGPKRPKAPSRPGETPSH